MAENENKAVTPQSKGGAVKRTNEKLGFFARVKKWFREMRSELKKVVWPTPRQFGKNIRVPLGMMALSAIVLWGFDSLASALVSALLKLTQVG